MLSVAETAIYEVMTVSDVYDQEARGGEASEPEPPPSELAR